MANANSLLLSFHVITAILIVVLILLQKGKGEHGIGIWCGASGTLFGAKGLQTLSSLLQQFSQQFFITSLTLAYLNKGTVVSESVLIKWNHQSLFQMKQRKIYLKYRKNK